MGNVIEELVYNSDALLDFKNIYTYDSTGKMTEKKYFGKSETRAHTYRYNSCGDIIEEVKYRSYNSNANIYSDYHELTKIIHKYDPSGNKIKEDCYSGVKDLSLDWVNSYKYNSNGILIEEINNNGEGSKSYVTMYDSAGNRVKRDEYSCDGVLITGDTFEYDLAGNLVKWIVYEDGLEYVRSTHEYDAVGNQVVSYYCDKGVQGGPSMWMVVSTITYR